MHVSPSLPLAESLIARAVAIADAASRSSIENFGVPLDSGRYGLADAAGLEVRTLAEAAPELSEAFEYLRDRGLAELLPDDGLGETIQLMASAVREG